MSVNINAKFYQSLNTYCYLDNMHKPSLVFAFFILSTTLVSASASVQDFSTDKPSYNEGDSIVITGKVDYDPSIPFVILQIITPDGSGLASIANIVPSSNGHFNKSVKAGGPTWDQDGKYTLKISYGENLEKPIIYKKNPLSTQTPSKQTPSKQTPDQSDVVNTRTEILDKSFTENPKMRLFGYPSLDNSPQYYIDRYTNEPDYRDWFDSQFPDYSITEVVGYPHTHVENYPSLDNSPQYYIDRYTNEPDYRDWFDSQFPEQTIFDVLGFSTYIPDWIKTYSKNWATGKTTDSEFIMGLDFMLTNKIIVISGLDYSADSSIDEVPLWFRNTAHWWSNDLISNQDFVNSIKYLVLENIISIEN